MNVKAAITKLKKMQCNVQRKGKDLYIVDDDGYTEQELIELAHSYDGQSYIPKEKPKQRGSSRRKKKVDLTRDWQDYDDDDYGDW